MSDKRTRINILSHANSRLAKTETRNGREVVVVPSVTLPDNVVMNGIKYPADEIANSYRTLERSPAPYGHPVINGEFVSAKDPVGINMAYIGAHNENVTRKNGRVYMDKVIDVEIANQSEKGREVLEAIKNEDPIHTSTGLFAVLKNCDDSDADSIATNMEFDHDAILLNEQGAATPEQGVGIFVNSSGEKSDVINSAVEWAERDLEWAVDSVLGALERRERATVVDRFKDALIEFFSGEQREEQKMNDSDVKEIKDALGNLSKTVGTLQESIVNGIKEGMKPLSDTMTEIQNERKAEQDAERSDLVKSITKANLLDEETAKELPLKALRNMAANLPENKGAAALSNGSGTEGDVDEFKDVDMNEGIREK